MNLSLVTTSLGLAQPQIRYVGTEGFKDAVLTGEDQAIQATMTMLDTLDHWIDETPPQPTPQRFGNLAFRQWGKHLEDVSNLIVSSVFFVVLMLALMTEL